MYESKAECRFLRNLGGDSVGMSTVPELIAAHHAGIKVLCLSLITNAVVISGDEGPAASHQEVLDAVNTRASQIQGLVKQVVKELHDSGTLDGLPGLKPVNLDADKCCKHKNQGVLSKLTFCPYTMVTKNLPCIMMISAAIAFGATMHKNK